MDVYSKSGAELFKVYDRFGVELSHVYDAKGNDLLNGEEPFVKRLIRYDTAMIGNAWLANATAQRDAVLFLFNQSADSIPFFIQTDGHGRKNEGNKGCHNLAEPTMGYIANIQLGDYGSFYGDGENPAQHAASSAGIEKYIGVMGNHEFLSNNESATTIADLPTLIESYTPPNAILGGGSQGYYKILDQKHHVKYLVFQPHIPVPKSQNSSGFIFKMASDQWDWAIHEMEQNDGFDIVIINHEPFPGTYKERYTGSENSYEWSGFNISPLLAARKAKQSGTITDADGVEHAYDFTDCQTDLLCALYGHVHHELYMNKEQLGFPSYVGDDFDDSGKCAYGLIDRSSGKLYIYSFTKDEAADPLVLDL